MARARSIARSLLAPALIGCATLAPPQSGILRAQGLPSPAAPSQPPHLALVGDVGIASPDAPKLAARIADRLRLAPDAPSLVLGDVFYRDGLLGLCAEGGASERSMRDCARATSPAAQLEAVLGPYRAALPGRALLAIAGNHDHYGDPAATANACALVPAFAPGWLYLARGCGLDGSRPVATLDLGPLVVFMVDSEAMIRDPEFRDAAAAALRDAIREERGAAWRVLAMHHPLESYGAHNGAHPLTALRKDSYWIAQTALLPLSWGLERTLLRRAGRQDLYERGYRAYRRALYRALRDAPVDLVASGHDHSLQLLRIEHPGAPYQLVSGAGAYGSPVKRFGLDLFFTNRLARRLGLGDVAPAPAHRLLFAAGPAVGIGYAALVAREDRLTVEIHAIGASEPLLVYEIRRTRGAQPSS
jgi:hypothetical protein